MAEKTFLTKEGYKDLENELRNLIDVVREDVKKQLAEARAQGDLSENADYDAARNRQAEVEGRIREIEAILMNCEIIADKKTDSKKAGIGSTVEFQNLSTNKVYTFKLVGTVESDPFDGKISNDSPLGAALIGAKEGDVIEVKGPRTYEIKILRLIK